MTLCGICGQESTTSVLHSCAGAAPLSNLPLSQEYNALRGRSEPQPDYKDQRLRLLRETLRHVQLWAEGRKKLADEQDEQGGEEFSDIARLCEVALSACPFIHHIDLGSDKP